MESSKIRDRDFGNGGGGGAGSGGGEERDFGYAGQEAAADGARIAAPSAQHAHGASAKNAERFGV